jgi:hypothetical protein
MDILKQSIFVNIVCGSSAVTIFKNKEECFISLYMFDRNKEWKSNCGAWHCLLAPESSWRQRNTLSPLISLSQTKLSFCTIVLACYTKHWT